MANPEVSKVLQAIEKAKQVVADLCKGKRRWIMRIPADPNHDPDLIIMEALRLSQNYINGVENPQD